MFKLQEVNNDYKMENFQSGLGNWWSGKYNEWTNVIKRIYLPVCELCDVIDDTVKPKIKTEREKSCSF